MPDRTKNEAGSLNPEMDILVENGHQFVPASQLGLSAAWRCCRECGIVRRTDGNNKACRGRVIVALRADTQTSDQEHMGGTGNE